MSSGVNAFDRVVINTRERPVSSDINAAQARLDQTLREVVRSLFIAHNGSIGVAGQSAFTPKPGFLADGFFARADGGSRVVTLNPGLGFLIGSGVSNFGSISGLDDLNTYFPAYLPAALGITIDAAPGSGQERYDRIEVKQDRRVENSSSRDILNTSTGLFEANLVNKTFAYMLDSNRYGRVAPGGGDSSAGISYKVGTAAAINSASPPAATTGYTTVAVIYSVAGVTNVRQQDVRDDRQLLLPNGVEPFAFNITQTDGTPDVVSVGIPGINPGLRVAARSLSSPGGSIKVIILGGGPSGSLYVMPHVQIFPSPSSSNFLAARVANAGADVLSAAEAALIASQVQAFGDTPQLQGQAINTFQIDRAVISGSDPGSRSYCVTGTLIRQ